MKLSIEVIEEAFQKHGQVYASGRAWDISYHVELWKTASTAFGDNNFEIFETVYEELRRLWQVFRGVRGEPWKASKIWKELQGLPAEYRSKRLLDLEHRDTQACWNILNRFAEIKPGKNRPYVVAISKFLHFWNPGLFVIVDRDVMWSWVFRHQWLWQQINEVRVRLAKELDVQCGPKGEACDLLSYLSILVWGAAIIRANPSICSTFAAHVRRHRKKEEVDTLPLETFDAAALEWLLLGLVEIPPAGVRY